MDDDRIRANGPAGRAVRPWRKLAFVGGACLVLALVLLALPSLLRQAEAAAPCAGGGSALLQGNCTCSCGGGACVRGSYCGISGGVSCACQCDATQVPPTDPPTQPPTEPPGGTPLPPSTPPPGGTPPPPSTPPPPTGTPEPGIDCFNCYPWAQCPGHYARVCFQGSGLV